ncbi:MAG: thioredoxin domain-containing protein [Steroidobacteraceae bacterium]
MPNLLANATSPYLLQHADNPVDWYPWGETALQRARAENKPILLSIGYSACHWCHVMAHESFEDPAIAALMNEHFINIKVDREERPDLDKVYQLAQQVLTQHAGGWPLTMFLSHETQQPFFGGTYFPPQARHGLPGFADLLTRVAQYYREHHTDVEAQQGALQQVFADLQSPPHTQGELHAQPLQKARTTLQERFDTQFGGFGTAPKFPQARMLDLLLRRWHASSGDAQPDLHALYISALTLTRMAEGGVYDQLGGGFFRYSVDQYWMIPHFEKMLYDNAELLRVYAQAAVATGEPLFKRVAGEIAQWMLRDMRAPEGAFWSTLDADSEGHEGRYYVWQPEQVAALLNSEEQAIFARRFGLDSAVNFEGQWHLHCYRSHEDIAKELNLGTETVEHELQHARQKLLAARRQRIAPGLDNKILTAWNGLAISALAQAARALHEPAFIDAACQTADQLRTQAWREGRLYAVQAGGQTQFPAYLDDYAYLLDALIELLQTRWRSTDLNFATQLAEVLLRHFVDRERGGFYFTADDHETLIHRPKTFADDATPAGNALAAISLQRLGWLLGESRYLQAAEQTLRADWSALEDHPAAHATLLVALEQHLTPPQLVIIRGPAPEANEWQQKLNTLYQPNRLVFAIPNEAELPAALQSKAAQATTVAYVCQGTQCSAPVNTLEALIALTR